ncbi:MAG TPA: M48 family metalloprotease [Usitatibacteraceae bacterium]
MHRWLSGFVLLAQLLALQPAHAQSLPDLGDSSDAMISEPQERAIGKRIMFEIRADPAYVDDPEILDYINSIGGKLVAASRGATNDNRRDFEFFVLNDDSINAFALPGGFIAVHSGLLLTTSNESELAGVMGHEIAHVLQRHQARGADEQRKAAPLSLLGLVAAVLAARSNSPSSGDTAQAALTASIALSYQNQLNYSRDFEREADRIGLQVMQRAGFDPSGMPSFFERMLRANRHNDGKTPGYLRTHPLTTERIAEMQDRVLQMGADGKRNVPDTIEYRLVSAKLRVMSMASNEAARFFRNTIAERTVLRSRADVYGLALALTRGREFDAADRELATIRNAGPAHPWIENLAAEIQLGQRKWDKALAIYQTGMRAFPAQRALLYGYLNTLYESGQLDAALTAANEQLKTIQDDPRLYEVAAKIYERKNKKLAQHRMIGEAYFRRGNLVGAIEQYEVAIKARDGDFYESSSAEARLRELKTEFRNRALLPGEKRERDRDDPGTRPGFNLSTEKR